MNDPEAIRFARYEPVQRETCEMAGAPWAAPDYTKLVWLGPTIPDGNRLVEGGRYAATDQWSGWSLMASDRPMPPPDEIRFEHLRHLVTIREDLMPYLGLPVGWTFQIFADGSWHAWSPKDRLLTWIPGFLDGTEATPHAAISIAELIAEQFDGTELRAMTEQPLLDWASGEASSIDDVRHTLTAGLEWLRSSPLR